jgi:DNA mismatch repair ATPase MutL
MIAVATIPAARFFRTRRLNTGRTEALECSDVIKKFIISPHDFKFEFMITGNENLKHKKKALIPQAESACGMSAITQVYSCNHNDQPPLAGTPVLVQSTFCANLHK